MLSRTNYVFVWLDHRKKLEYRDTTIRNTSNVAETHLPKHVLTWSQSGTYSLQPILLLHFQSMFCKLFICFSCSVIPKRPPVLMNSN